MNIDPTNFSGLPMEHLIGSPRLPAAEGTSFLAEVYKKSLSAEGVQDTAPVQPQGLEERLKARYPGLVYHVFDGSSRCWRSRQDYPFHKIHQQGTDPAEIENWRPSGPNPDPLSPQVQRNLGSIPPGSKAVIIHPAVQKRMEEDPAYADVIYDRIEAWFTFDVARNEAILPGCTAGMSQCLAIGEDGEIANVQACSSGGGITRSKSGDDDEESFWDARLKRHRAYMRQVVEAQILHALGLTGQLAALRQAREKGAASVSTGGSRSGMDQQFAALQSSQLSQAAIAQTVAMMNDPQLREALGETVAGTPLDTVFQCTRDAITSFHPTAIL